MKSLKFLFAIIFLSAVASSCDIPAPKSEPVQNEWAIAIHGGAGFIPKTISEERKKALMESMEQALAIGTEILKNGGSSLDAVEKVVNYLEDNPGFNAGKGAVFTSESTNELDAAIMDGSTLSAGAVAGLKTVKNPISLARKVMENSNHIFFAGSGAETFAKESGVELVEPSYFYTERSYEAWKRAVQSSGSLIEPFSDFNDKKFGTVGCVALDKNGNLAAATSTGGMTNKKFGRVGDVPIIGAGTYANNLVAVSATGWGERIMRSVSAHKLAAYMEFKEATLDDAMSYIVHQVLEPGDAGFIAVDKWGNFSMDMNTGSMSRAAENSSGAKIVAIWEE